MKKTSNSKFIFPEKKDEDIISENDIVCKLPDAILIGATERTAKHLSFNFDFSPFNVQ